MRYRLRDQRGQAMTETILLTWILLVFIAAIYQLFLVNHTVYSSLAVVHTRLFEQAFTRNCAAPSADCKYTTDDRGRGARVVWTPQAVPEVVVPVVGMFASTIPDGLRLESTRYIRGSDHLCPGRPCKRTKVGSGTYKNPLAGLVELPGIVAGDGFLQGYLDDLDMYLLQSVLGGALGDLF